MKEVLNKGNILMDSFNYIHIVHCNICLSKYLEQNLSGLCKKAFIYFQKER